MTAEKFINDNSYFILNADTPMGNILREAMIGFAKYHVEQALLKASEEATLDYEKYCPYDAYTCEIDVNTILNAYPLSNIK